MEALMVRSIAKRCVSNHGGTLKRSQLANPSFADLVVLARSLNPFPYRTRPLNSSAPMVLSLKAWKSRSLPGLPRTKTSHHDDKILQNPPRETAAGFCFPLIQINAARPRRREPQCAPT